MVIGKGVKREPGSGVPGSSPMLFRLDPGSGVPTYLQLVQQVEQALLLGYLTPGDQLPKVRDVVTDLAINPNTVLKAYRELEHKGLAAGRPGQGTFIQSGAHPRGAARAVRVTPSAAALANRGGRGRAGRRASSPCSAQRCGISLSAGATRTPAVRQTGPAQRRRCRMNVLETSDSASDTARPGRCTTARSRFPMATWPRSSVPTARARPRCSTSRSV